ncbi:hypothetical protein [uncultured Veillonella sp.]|uniref:hypothetical protein n=1 Tax=uncultured Veillonella sp. TaxID=159268 RepID=UPI0028DCE1C9|nr:hypothetical protein [uncultured Veillonella sp.]
MSDCKQFYDNICKEINRSTKLKDFETIFRVKQGSEDKNVKLTEVQKFAANFYKVPIINYKGHVTDKSKVNNTRYSEVIADTLVSKGYIKTWLELEPLRPNHFDTGHNHSEGVDINKLQISNRKEEILAKLLFYQGEVKDLGYIFDYQTPLKKTKDDSYGKIDLLGYNSKDKCYSIIELKYRPSGSEETLLRCVLEAYTYYKLFDLNQIESAQDHNGITELRALKNYKHTKNAELVILFDEKSRAKNDGGENSNLMLRIDLPNKDKADKTKKVNYPSKTVESQQHKECQELLTTDKRDSLRILCEAILKQEPNLKQIRFVVLRADTDSKSSYPTNIKGWSRKLDRLYRAETLLTIPSKG